MVVLPLLNNRDPDNPAQPGERERTMNKELKCIYKPEENKLVIPGTLTAYRYSGTKYANDKELYQVSIKTEALTQDLIDQLKEDYFSDTKDKFLPSFIKKFDNGEVGSDGVFVNLKSQYEIPAFVEGQGNKRYGFDDVIELGEGLPPHGSLVKLSCRLKEGSIYPLAVMFVEIRKQDVSEYFE